MLGKEASVFFVKQEKRHYANGVLPFKEGRSFTKKGGESHMTNFTKKAFSVIAAATVVLNAAAAAPVFADTTLVVSGNGSSSDNAVNVANNNNAVVTQNNNAVVTNSVTSNATTGGNEASKNTGGNTGIETGNAKSVANVATSVNANQAVIDPCNCNNGNTKVVIKGNGDGSESKATLENTNTATVNQNNTAVVVNDVNTNAKTGNNEANKNTAGNSTILTGDATAKANVTTNANANIAQIDGGNGKNGGSTQLLISGNGSDSENRIKLKSNNEAQLVQGNSAVVTNDIDSNAFTGKNEAEKNTGGNTKIFTGNADATANVDNAVNFNAANISNCGCGGDVIARVDGNGDSSENKIKAAFTNDARVWQGGDNGNEAVLVNEVGADAKTGKNEAEKNTGTATIGDPVVVFTGDATTNTTVSNRANENVFGVVPTITWPGTNGSNFDFNFNFSFNGLVGGNN